MKKLLLTMFVFLATTIAFAQSDYQEAVYLKSGNIIRGIIIEQVPNESLKVETADGSLFVLKISEIEKIAKERIATSQVQIQPAAQTQKTVSAPQQNTTVSRPAQKKEMEYFNKVMKSNNYNTRKKHIGLIENEELLYEIASNYSDKDRQTAIDAISKIKNEELLCKIALEASSIRQLVVGRINNEDLLYKIAAKCFAAGDFTSYSKALSGIASQELLYQLVKDIKNKTIGLQTIDKIFDPGILKKLADSSAVIEVRIDALKKIDDQSYLYDFVLSDNNYQLNNVAFNKLNEEMLQKIVADKNSNNSIKSNAISKITDQQFLCKTVNDNQFDKSIHTAALSKMTDQECLYKIMIWQTTI